MERLKKLNDIKTNWISEVKLNKGMLNEEDYMSVLSKEKPEETSQYG